MFRVYKYYTLNLGISQEKSEHLFGFFHVVHKELGVIYIVLSFFLD